MKSNIERRDFVKGGVAGTTLAMLGLLAGCSPRNGGLESGDALPETSEHESFVMDSQSAQSQWSFEIPPDPIREDDIRETVEADIVVVGGGTSGLCTALSAVEQGASVVLISASKAPVSRGGSIHGVKSKIMEKFGIQPYDLERYTERERILASNAIDQKKWMRFVRNSEESINWLADHMDARGVAMGIEQGAPATLFGPDDVQHVPLAAHGAYSDDMPAGIGQPLVVNALADILVEKGGDVRFQIKGEQLVRDDDGQGRVSAVIARDLKDDGLIKFAGKKAIVLATGDFSADKEMMAKYCPSMLGLIADDAGEDYDIGLYTKGLYKGDGHKMGLWVGAAWQRNVPNCPMVNVAQGTGAHAFCGHCGLLLNVRGERFSNELALHSFSGRAILNQPEGKAYAIWGTNYAEENGPWYIDGLCTDAPLTASEMLASWDVDADDGYFLKCDTLEEMVDALGLPADTALASIARYNELCEKGDDEDFMKRSDQMIPIKEGPFYGMEVQGRFLTVLGGLRTNEKMQVCQEDDTPIEGLYNVGTMIGDYFANTYTFLMEGANYGNCVTFGYLLGRDLAAL